MHRGNRNHLLNGQKALIYLKYKHWHPIGTHTETDIEFRRALKDGSVQWLGKVIESEFLF